MNWEKVWIIGNGPSCHTFDRTRLVGQNVLVINRALYDYYHEADAFFSLDRQFIVKNAENIGMFNGEKHIALPDRCPFIQDASFYAWSHKDGLSDDPRVISTGCNSGFGAINLCYHHYTTEIHLVGYEMDPRHNDQFRFWSKNFDKMIPQLEARGIKVWNHNVDSFITAFERVE